MGTILVSSILDFRTCHDVIEGSKLGDRLVSATDVGNRGLGKERDDQTAMYGGVSARMAWKSRNGSYWSQNFRCLRCTEGLMQSIFADF